MEGTQAEFTLPGALSRTHPVRKWMVMVDGSSVSGKAFDCVCSFMDVQHTKGGTDEITVVHACDPKLDAELPFHMRGSRILNSYDTNMIRARRIYDEGGKGHLKCSTMSLSYDSSGPQVPVAQLEWAQSVNNVESAPPVVAALIRATHQTVHPDFLFMGSFGLGGKKVGLMGSVTDYVIRLVNTTVVVVKHWRPVPKLFEPRVFVCAIDESPASMKALHVVVSLCKPDDKIIGLTMSRHQGPKDQEILDNAQAVISSYDPALLPSSITLQWGKLDDKGTAAQSLCSMSEQLEADFLVIGSINTARGSKNRERMYYLGSTALYCATHSKCHSIIVKPSINMEQGAL